LIFVYTFYSREEISYIKDIKSFIGFSMMKSEKILIEGMSCSHCVTALRKALGKLPLNIISVGIGYAEISYEESELNHYQISDAVKSAGYSIKRNSI